MPSPFFTFSFIIATMFGATFHLFLGGDARRLALFLLTGWFGFALGHLIGELFEIDLFNIGSLHMLSASISCVFCLFVVQVITSGQSRRRRRRRRTHKGQV